MIKFFRHTGKRLLTENPPESTRSVRAGKFCKYLLYAIGEIVLVVNGVLIALQANNWNEKRKSEEEAVKIRQVLHSEFSGNRIVLAERIRDLLDANKNVGTELSFTNKEGSEIHKQE